MLKLKNNHKHKYKGIIEFLELMFFMTLPYLIYWINKNIPKFNSSSSELEILIWNIIFKIIFFLLNISSSIFLLVFIYTCFKLMFFSSNSEKRKKALEELKNLILIFIALTTFASAIGIIKFFVN